MHGRRGGALLDLDAVLVVHRHPPTNPRPSDILQSHPYSPKSKYKVTDPPHHLSLQDNKTHERTWEMKEGRPEGPLPI